MKPRKQPYGNKNICGATIERLRKERGMKVQLQGVDMNPSSLSKLEGQQRAATDIELKAISSVFGVSIDDLINP